jgi:hypothetical protein
MKAMDNQGKAAQIMAAGVKVTAKAKVNAQRLRPLSPQREQVNSLRQLQHSQQRQTRM